MTDSEKRRKQLLQQTRILYNDNRTPPAVHPRYQSVYSKLYQFDENTEAKCVNSTLGVRIFISILLFALFIVADYKKFEYAEVNSTKIIQEIEKDTDIKKYRENLK